MVARARTSVVTVLSLLAGLVAVLAVSASPASAEPPSNDTIAGATALTLFGSTRVDNREATRPLPEEERLPQADGCSQINRNVWFTFRAAATRTLRLRTPGAGVDTVLAAYTGPVSATTIDQLTYQGCNDDVDPSGSDRTSNLSLPVTAGQLYYVQVGVYATNGSGGVFDLQSSGDVANDNLSTAAPVADGDAVAGDNTAATTEVDEPAVTGQGCDDLVASVWFRFTATSGGSRELSTGSDVPGADTVVRLWSGPASSATADALTPVGCDDDSGTGALSRLDVDVTAATTYYVQVGTRRASASGGDPGPGAFSLTLRDNSTDVPPNDDVADAVVLFDVGSTTGTTRRATVGADEPTFDGTEPRSVWFRWRAPATNDDAFVRLVVPTGSRFFLCVFTDTGPTTVESALGCSDATGPDAPEVDLDTTRDVDYRVVVGSTSGSGASFTVSNGFRPPANDDRADAVAIDGDSGSVAVDHQAATREDDDPVLAAWFGGAGERSVWYRYTASRTGGVVFETDAPASASTTVLGAYEAASGGGLQQVAGFQVPAGRNDRADNSYGTEGLPARLEVGVRAGRSYLVRVDGYGPIGSDADTDLTLTWSRFVGAPTTTTLTEPVVSGDTATIGATTVLTSPDDGTSLQGVFEVLRGGTVVDTTDTADGSETLSVPLVPGANQLTVRYTPDDYVVEGSSTTTTATRVVSTTTSLGAVRSSRRVTLTATPDSGAGAPPGSVRFSDGTTVLGTVPLRSGSAVLLLPSVRPGSHTYRATYVPTSGSGYLGRPRSTGR